MTHGWQSEASDGLKGHWNPLFLFLSLTIYLLYLVHFDREMCFTPQWHAILICHLASWLPARRFSDPIFWPFGATNQSKNTMLCDFLIFSRICNFFLLTLTLLWSSLFYSPLLSASATLCFSSCHIVGCLTSKLPSMNMQVMYAY